MTPRLFADITPNLGPGPGFWIVCASIGAVGGVLWTLVKLWTWFKSLFPSIEEHNALKDRLVKLEVAQASAEKLNGKLDQILNAIEKRRRHD